MPRPQKSPLSGGLGQVGRVGSGKKNPGARAGSGSGSGSGYSVEYFVSDGLNICNIWHNVIRRGHQA